MIADGTPRGYCIESQSRKGDFGGAAGALLFAARDQRGYARA